MSETKKKVTQTIKVNGTAEKKTEAFANALNSVQQNVLKNTNDVILRIEPVDVLIELAEERTYKEKFLFFFIPRMRTDYHVVLNVIVEITMIEIERVKFVKKETKDPNAISLPLLKKN